MADPDENRDHGLDRRTFLKGGLLAGGLLGGGLAIRAAVDSSGGSTPSTHSARQRTGTVRRQAHPNILVIVVDQLRYPQWFSPTPVGLGLPSNLQRLRRGGVAFARHYTNSNDCTAARSALLTGLYTHQTGCMITGGSTLDPGFPTWGTMLREHGYRTRWFGKWHLTHHDNRWTPLTGEAALAGYGFEGGTFPSPDGAPGQGWRVDPKITSDFVNWLSQEGGEVPWCTTVSFVNPHDIAWWYAWTNRVAAETTAGHSVTRLPPNFETPEQLIERRKPRLQRSFQATTATAFGPVPFHGPGAQKKWLEFLNLYVKIQREVDRQIGTVLDALESRPHVAANTVVVFTSDHGEYGSSHGLRGKGASAYEEGIRVPLVVKDPRGELTSSPEVLRTQLTSHVDVAPMLLSIATGSDDWRSDPLYSHIAHRADLMAILADPGARGRRHVLHATDEIVTEFAIEPYAADAPLHVVAMRTPQAKYALYSHWPETGIRPLAAGQEAELYDYGTQRGRLELENTAGHSPLEATLRKQLQAAVAEELHEHLPRRLREAHIRGFADYFSTARHAATAAAAHRKARSEREVGPLQPGDTGEGRRN